MARSIIDKDTIPKIDKAIETKIREQSDMALALGSNPA